MVLCLEESKDEAPTKSDAGCLATMCLGSTRMSFVKTKGRASRGRAAFLITDI